MNRYLGLVSICIVSLFFLSIVGYAQTDSSFKSIHQLELEQHQEDTIQRGTAPESTVTTETQAKAVINLSLLIVISIILIAVIAIYFIVRSMSQSQRE